MAAPSSSIGDDKVGVPRAEVRCSFRADGEALHEIAVALDASLDTAEHPLGAVDRVLEDVKTAANAFMSVHVEREREALGGSADDGWHELNDEAGGGESSDEEAGKQSNKAKRKAAAKKKRDGK
jgi:hypothetical protein